MLTEILQILRFMYQGKHDEGKNVVVYYMSKKSMKTEII